MEYLEVTLTLPQKRAQTAVDIAEMTDLEGVYLEDYADLTECELVQQISLIDEELLKKDKETAILHLYFERETNLAATMEYIQSRLDAESIPYTISYEKVEDTEWLNGWKKYYKPLKIGAITVVPAWETYAPEEGETVLRIDPGLAFGTGSHETTSSCIEALQECVQDGDRVLDVGCGSGILSIAALLCGARNAFAIDIDPNAARVAKENAALNPIADQFDSAAGNILEEELDPQLQARLNGEGFDIAVANIVADVIIPLSGRIRAYLKEGGWFITSGILSSRADEVRAALEKNGFTVCSEKRKNEWVCFLSR